MLAVWLTFSYSFLGDRAMCRVLALYFHQALTGYFHRLGQ